MACVALTSLMGTVMLEFIQPCPRVSLEDQKAIKSLFEKLFSLQAFLQNESSGGAVIRDLEIKIKDFALKAEDDIEIQLSNILLAKDREHQEKARGELHQTLGEVVKDAEELLKIINNTSNEPEVASDTLSSIHCLKPASHPENVVSGGSSRCSPKLEDIMVGHQNVFTAIRDELLRIAIKDGLLRDYDQQLIQISIFGMAGIGKTTLARRVYSDRLVMSYYDIQAWVTVPQGYNVPQEYNVQQILCNLHQSMMPTVNKIKGSNLFQLKEQLCKHLKGKRYLIVLDDVWNAQVFYDIVQCFPNDSNGSCILLTTRLSDVRYQFYPSVHIQYPMSLLDPYESWDLFCKRLSLKEYIAPKFQEIGKRVVEQCQGLPRSIVAVAERLSKCNYILKEWKKVEKEIESLGTLYSDAQHFSKLTLTYTQLPQHLKVCFLYFAVFPKDSEIKVKMLIRLWIAEGFVMPLWNMPLEAIAYGYLGELAARNLVMIKHVIGDEIKICKIHNDLHSFCIREAQKEGLFCAVNIRQCLGWSLNMIANSSRWLSLYSHSLDYYVFFSSNNPRSLFFFHGDPEMFVPFKLLRILDFSQSPILNRVPLHLGDLVFLRYLSVPQWFEGLDYVMSTNPNLQTLIVSGIESKLGAPTLHLSSRIWESPQIRHLKLGNLYTVDPPSMVKEHLQTLSWVRPPHCRKEVYYRFPNLKKLKIFYKDVFEPSRTCGFCRNSIIILDNVEYLLQLEALTVLVPVGSITLLEQPVFPTQLKKLRLSGTNLPVKVLRVIGQMPKLQVLKLENAFYGRVWEPAEGGFRALEFLLLEARNLERWVADASHFPRLWHLILRRCHCLEDIPRQFANIPTLHLIELELCPPSVVTYAKWIQNRRELELTVDGSLIHRYANMEEFDDES